MVKRLQEKDVELGAAYKAGDAHFVIVSKHTDQAYVRFDDGEHGYVAYGDMEEGE